MGTISEKLTYLNETKQELKEAINNIGGNIDNNTTFREYVEELQDIYDNLPKTSYREGTNISLANTNKGKLDFDNLLYGDTSQDGTPTPETPVDINVVTGTQEIEVVGKNLIDFSNSTLTKYYGNSPTKNTNSVTGGWGYYLVFPKPIPAGSYTLSYDVSNNDNANGATLALTDSSSTTISGTSKGIGTSGTKTATFTSAVPIAKIKVDNGKNASTTTISNIQLEVGSSNTTYEPYSSTSYTISLGDIELYDEGYISKEGDKWYINNSYEKYSGKLSYPSTCYNATYQRIDCYIPDNKTAFGNVTPSKCDKFNNTPNASVNSVNTNASFIVRPRKY